MVTSSPGKTIILFVSLLATVIILSTVSTRLWGGKPEKLPDLSSLVVSQEMTLKDFGQTNGLPNPSLKKIFGLQNKSDLQKKLSEYGTDAQIKSQVKKNLALAAEHESKNWKKILIKFSMWFAFLLSVFILFRKQNVSSIKRKTALFSSVLIFGVILGADPSPMGTVKDAIHLFASAGAIFPPRMMALTVFLLLVFLANKFICSWGCQVGTLQDLIFRINRNESHKAVIGRQIKIPFYISNTIRVTFLAVFTIAAFGWGTDIIEFIDPFKVFKPIHLDISGIIFVGSLLVASLFVYRPWCHLCCPFGLAGWLVEKISLNKISVNYETCIACEKCVTACPSTVMGALLKQDKTTIPDCFSCYSCREICPTNSIEFSTRKRTPVPADHFDKKRPIESQ
jgi:polyferredoxin